MKKILALVLALCMVFALAACAAPAAQAPAAEAPAAEAPKEVYTIKFGITNGLANEEEPETIFVNTLSKLLEEKTDGGLVLEVYPNLQLGSMEEQRDMVMSGTLEGFLPNMNTLASVYPDTQALVCPGLYADEAEINRVLRGEWGQEFFQKMAEETNLYVVGVASNGMRCYTSSKAPLTTVDSIKGQTIRVMQNPMCVDMAESIGINAVPMPGSEMYNAMQQGTVDGQENPINSIINDKTYEVQKYLVLDRHMPSILAFVFSYDFVKSLPADYQVALKESVLGASEAMAAAIDRVNVEGVEFLKEQGIEVYEPVGEELAAWQDPAYEACSNYIAQEIGRDTLDSLSAAIAESRK